MKYLDTTTPKSKYNKEFRDHYEGYFFSLRKKYLNLIDKNDIWTDQVIWTLIYRDNKELFFKLCDNYASIPFYLY